MCESTACAVLSLLKSSVPLWTGAAYLTKYNPIDRLIGKTFGGNYDG